MGLFVFLKFVLGLKPRASRTQSADYHWAPCRLASVFIMPPGILTGTKIEDLRPEPPLSAEGSCRRHGSLIYGYIERQAVYIYRVYRGDLVGSDGHGK